MKHKYAVGEKTRKRSWFVRVVVVLIVFVLLVAGGMVAVRQYYYKNLEAVGSSKTTQEVVIKQGALAPDIAAQLHTAGLIRSKPAFLWYVKSKNASDKIMAGTYRLQPSLTTPEIVAILTKGKVATDLVTILPGLRLDEVRANLIAAGFSEAAVDRAMDPNLYIDNPALVDKPAGASLEGYLYPESFMRDASTQPEDIITGSLAEMNKQLTPEIRAAFAAKGLSTYQGIVLASVVEQEAFKQSDRDQVAQVFLARLARGMRLESDVTAFYGARLAGAAPSVAFSSPYNTYLVDGLPPGPISNVSTSSLMAVAKPANTNWLYFVAGDDGNTYFSSTLAEHEALTKQHCIKLCGN